MPPALDESVKERVRRLWFSGERRNDIASQCGIGAGSVTNIVDECTKGLDSSEYDEIRELAVQLKKEGLTFAELASLYRHHNYIKKLGVNEDQIESLIVNLLDSVKSTPAEKIAEMTDQIFEIAKSESIAPADVPGYVKQKMEEKQRIEEEIQKAGAILEDKKIGIQTIEEYEKLEERLKKYGLSMEGLNTLVSILQTIDEIGNDARKILTELARIKSLRETERRLKRECKMLESQSVQYKEILPTCQQIARLGIGFPELMMFQTAITKRPDMENLPPGRAAYRVMQDIEDYNRHGGMKKQLYDTLMQINMTKEFLGLQNDAINTFMKLRLYGMTEDQILKSCKIIEKNGHNLNSNPMQSVNPYFGLTRQY
jgi:hypothetical protein